MLYKFGFSITDDGYLKAMAFAKGLENLSAVHLNAKVFAAAVGIAGIPEPDSLELVAAAEAASVHPGVDICCEQVDVTREQLQILCPRARIHEVG
jgi:hypothetical protein